MKKTPSVVSIAMVLSSHNTFRTSRAVKIGGKPSSNMMSTMAPIT